MKIKKWILGFAVPVFCILVAFGSNKSGYRVKGIIGGLDTGTIYFLTTNLESRLPSHLDSASIVNGQFMLTGKIDSAQMVDAAIFPGNISFSFFLENKELEINADTSGSIYYKDPSTGKVIGCNVKHVKESGSTALMDINAFLNDANFIYAQKSIDSLYQIIDSKKDNQSLLDERLALVDSISKKALMQRREKLQQYIQKHPEAVAGTYMLWTYNRQARDLTIEDLEQLLNRFKEEARLTTYYGDLVKELLRRKAVMVGEIAPDFTLLKRDSSRFTLSSTRGKYVMIDFWASWCAPCRASIPHWKEVYQKYHDRGFEIVSISNDRLRQNWIRAMEVEKMPWIQVRDTFPFQLVSSTVLSLYTTHAIPHYVLLDKRGKILVKATGEHEDIDKELKKIFGL